jgi:hypothetical protein
VPTYAGTYIPAEEVCPHREEDGVVYVATTSRYCAAFTTAILKQEDVRSQKRSIALEHPVRQKMCLRYRLAGCRLGSLSLSRLDFVEQKRRCLLYQSRRRLVSCNVVLAE